MRRFLIAVMLLAACHRTNITKTQWQAMSPNERMLYVRTLVGHEQAKQAKGGNDRRFHGTADKYTKRIDQAYAHGDRRTVDAIFETMGTAR